MVFVSPGGLEVGEEAGVSQAGVGVSWGRSVSFLGRVSAARFHRRRCGRRCSRQLPPSARSRPLQRRLLCAENILLLGKQLHKGRATGRVRQDVQLPLQGPSRARRALKAQTAATNAKVVCRRQAPGPVSAGRFNLLLQEGRAQGPRRAAVPQTHALITSQERLERARLP